MTNFLENILAVKQREVAAAKHRVPIESLRDQIAARPPALDFCGALTTGQQVSLIAEVKQASPSRGVIRADFDPVQIAAIYAESGASCISVLTDENFFRGHLDDLRQIRDNIAIPILRKDFIVDHYQILEARAAGADAVLLIAECLDSTQLLDLQDEILSLGMTPLVEIHEQQNLTRVLEANSRLIGINNRNLKTFETDLMHCVRIRQQIPGDRIVVAESGIATAQDVAVLALAQIDAMLVGEFLMQSLDIRTAVRTLLQPD